MALFGFGRSRDGEADRRASRARVETWSREAGGYGDAVVVKVNEIVCADPACPGFETVILVMVPGERSVAHKIAKPLAQVALDDVARVIRAVD